MLRPAKVATLIAIGVVGAGASRAEAAAVYAFDCFVPGADAANCAAASAQISMSVIDPGNGQILFEFTNRGASPLSITDIYFDDGSLLGISDVLTWSQPGVNFSVGATPRNLPGGQNLAPPFETSGGGTQYFSADSNAPVQPSGVNPGERVGIVFDLLPGKTYADTLFALTVAGAADGLRVGLHLQGFADGGSVSVVNGATAVPLPPAAAMLLAAVAGLGSFSRRRCRTEMRTE